MALTHFAFGRVDAQAASALIPVMNTVFASEAVTPSGSNQTTTAAASSTLGTHICRVATDTAVYVSFGSTPNAGSDTRRFFVPAGAVEYFTVNASEKGAVINA